MQLSLLIPAVVLMLPTGLLGQSVELPVPKPDVLGESSDQAKQAKKPEAGESTIAEGHALVYGVVVDAEGQPLVGARFVLGSPDTLETQAAFERPLARTNAKGEFELRLAAPVDAEQAKKRTFLLVVGEQRVALRVKLPKLRYTTDESWPLAETQEAKQAELGLDVMARLWGRKTERKRRGTDLKTLVLRRGVPLQGRVTDADGKPIERVRVTARDLLAQSHFRGIIKNADHYSYAVTRADGTFDLPGVFSTGSLVSFAKAGFFEASLPVVGTKDRIELRIYRNSKVAGKIVGQESQLATGSIQVVYEVSSAKHSEKIGKDGAFEFGLKHPHRYRLIITPTGASAKLYGKTYSPVFSSGQDSLVIKLDPKVSKPKKKPAPKPKSKPAPKLGFPISVVEKHSGRPLKTFKAGTVWATVTMADNGPYLIAQSVRKLKANKQPGYIRVQPPTASNKPNGGVVVQAKGYATNLTKIEWDEDVQPRPQIEMVPESILAGVVRDANTGNPVTGAKVACYAYTADRRKQWTTYKTTNSSGRYVFDGLWAGHYRLAVNHKGRLANRHEIGLLAEERRSDVDFEIQGGASVEGRIYGVEIGTKWQAQLLTEGNIRSLSYNPGYRPSGPKCALDKDGRFEFTGVKPGYYEVCLYIPQNVRLGNGFLIPLEPIRVRQKSIDLEIDASRDTPGRIRGKVAVTGVEFDTTRLLVVARSPNPLDLWTYSYRSNIDLSGSRSQVQSDGTFDIELITGSHRLVLIDMLTGVSMSETEVPVDVGPGEPVVRNFRLDLVAVRVKIEPKEQGGSTAASWLDIDVDSTGAAALQMWFGGVSTNKKPTGVSLVGQRGELNLILPLRKTKLRVRSDASRLARDKQKILAVIGESELIPQSGKVNEVKIVVEVPVGGFDPEESDKKDKAAKAQGEAGELPGEIKKDAPEKPSQTPGGRPK